MVKPSTAGDSMARHLPSASEAVFVCASDQLQEGECRKVQVMFRQQVDSVWVFRVAGEVKAYRNRCVHMPRALDCESQKVFDAERGALRCSMHGIVYSGATGESLSDICRGKKLTSIRTLEVGQLLYIKDRRVKPL